MEKQSLSQQTARRLYGLIAAEKKLSPGEKLPNELELSQEMGVSRATLREAIAVSNDAAEIAAVNEAMASMNDIFINAVKSSNK